MNIQKPIGVGIFALVVVLMWVFFGRNEGVSLIVKTITENTEQYDIYAEYPQFSHVSDEFNEGIETGINEAIQSFKDEVSDMGEGVQSSKKEFSGSWESAQMNEKIISIIIRTSYYTGGAHGGRDIKTFSYDVDKDTPISLADLFPKTPDFLEKLSRYSISDLQKSLAYAEQREPNIDMIVLGASPDIRNFTRFTVSRDGMITLYFPEYQVAPYASGEQKVVMPISFIEPKSNE